MCAIIAETGEVREATLSEDPRELIAWIREAGFPQPLRCCYESGPTGFGLAWALNGAGVECVVAATSKLPYRSDRQKNDRVDEFVEWVSGRHEQSGLAGELSMLRSLLGFADSKGLTENARWFVPRGRYVRQAPVPAFTEAELKAIVGAIDNATDRGKRDLAMILLAAKMGARSSEVVALKLADIDWEKRALLIRQAKTRSQLLLPAPDDVLDALADYILNARPDAGFEEVFLTLRAPFGPFRRGCALWWVCKPYYDAAGVLEGKTSSGSSRPSPPPPGRFRPSWRPRGGAFGPSPPA